MNQISSNFFFQNQLAANASASCELKMPCHKESEEEQKMSYKLFKLFTLSTINGEIQSKK